MRTMVANFYLFNACRATIALATAFLIFGCCTLNAQTVFPSKRSNRDFRLDYKSFLKLSRADDSETRFSAIFNLCLLHAEIVGQEHYETSKQLQGFRANIAKRLKTFTHDQKIAAKRQRRNIESSPGYESSVHSSPVIKESGDGAGEVYAIEQSVYEASYAMSQFTGGPQQFFAFGGGAGMPPWDNAEALIELIETTIAPSSWRSNGGNGVIIFYRPSGALVVSSSGIAP